MPSEFFTRAFVPTVVAVTWLTNRHLWLSSKTSPVGFLPFATPSRKLTAPRTPPAVPTTTASDALRSPQTSLFLFRGDGSSVGRGPATFKLPPSLPPPSC